MRTFVILLLTAVASCTTAIRQRLLPANPAWEMVYVADNTDICFDTAESDSAQTIYRSRTHVMMPSVSPDRSKIVFFELNDRHGALKIVEVEGMDSPEHHKWGETIAEIEGPAGHRMALFPPVWDGSGESVLFVNGSGIERIWLDRRHETVVLRQGIVSATVSEDAERIACTDGEYVYFVGNDGSEIARYRTRSAVVPGRQEVQPVAFSPDGHHLAYGANRFLFTLDLRTMENDEVIDTVDPVYWIQWLPDQSGLVFVTGHSIRNVRMAGASAPHRRAGGSFEVFSIEVNGHGLKKLYGNGEVDAHLVRPTLSPDGRYLMFVSGSEQQSRVEVLWMGGGAITDVDPARITNFPGWLPDGQASRQLSEVITVYPVK